MNVIVNIVCSITQSKCIHLGHKTSFKQMNPGGSPLGTPVGVQMPLRIRIPIQVPVIRPPGGSPIEVVGQPLLMTRRPPGGSPTRTVSEAARQIRNELQEANFRNRRMRGGRQKSRKSVRKSRKTVRKSRKTVTKKKSRRVIKGHGDKH